MLSLNPCLNPLFLIIASTAGFVALSVAALVLKSCSDRKARKNHRTIRLDLEHLREGEEIVWVGNTPYIVGGSK